MNIFFLAITKRGIKFFIQQLTNQIRNICLSGSSKPSVSTLFNFVYSNLNSVLSVHNVLTRDYNDLGLVGAENTNQLATLNLVTGKLPMKFWHIFAPHVSTLCPDMRSGQGLRITSAIQRISSSTIALHIPASIGGVA